MPRKPGYDRDDLINRARDVFWAQGWSGTSLKDLEQVLKLKPGSFYAAFGSKDTLYELALDRYADEGLARLRGLAEREGPLRALQSHPRIVLESGADATRACMLAKTYLELNSHAHPLAERAGAHLARMEAGFTELFAQAQRDGQIGAAHDPRALARRYQSDLLGLRLSAERAGFDAMAVATQMAEDLGRL